MGVHTEMTRIMCDSLLRKRVSALRRVADALWIGFGEEAIVILSDGKEHKRYEYMLRVQCPFRILNQQSVILGSQDMHYPRDVTTASDFSWKQKGKSVLDAAIETVMSQGCITVTAVSVEDNGSLHIALTNSMRFDAFVNGSLNNIEYWRLNSYSSERKSYVVWE